MLFLRSYGFAIAMIGGDGNKSRDDYLVVLCWWEQKDMGNSNHTLYDILDDNNTADDYRDGIEEEASNHSCW